MEEVRTHSTSLSSATVSEITLRQTSTTRLVFRPMLVDNRTNPSAGAEGTFVFQKKGRHDAWEDVPTESLGSLKKEDSYKLALSSEETRKLFDGLTDLYSIHSAAGVPRGDARFVRARGALADLADFTDQDLQTFLAAQQTVGAPVVARLLEWATNAQQLEQLLSVLERLDANALTNLKAAVSISALRESITLWRQNSSNADEGFWQTALSQRSFILEQLFAWPCTIIEERAFLGGKTIHNQGGHLVDFLIQNELTTSAALVEIKTPATPLTGAMYRDGIPNVSRDLAGAVMQVITYKNSLIEHYRSMRDDQDSLRVFDPPCTVIIGNCDSLETPEQKRTFELFRRQLSGVQVVTFDELFKRVEKLGELLAGTTEELEEEDVPEVPF